MKTAVITEIRPGHFRIDLRTGPLYWRGTRGAVLSALRSLGYVVTLAERRETVSP
jgi:hypothetical protein